MFKKIQDHLTKRDNFLLFLLLVLLVSLPLVILSAQKRTHTRSSAKITEELSQDQATFHLYNSEIPSPDDSLVVKFKKNTTTTEKNKVIRSLGGTQVQEIKPLKTYKLQIPKGKASEYIEKYKNNPQVEYAEPVVYCSLFFTPDDPKFSQQWRFPKINALKAWDMTMGKKDIIVALVDTGVAKNHPDISSAVKKWHQTSGIGLYDKNGHGTHNACNIAAITNNSIGVAGIAPNISLYSINATRYHNREPRLKSTDIAAAIYWSADYGADIINLSLGSKKPMRVVEDAIKYAQSKGVTIIAAAGNLGGKIKSYPAAYPGVISVAATTKSDKKAKFSSYGTWVDLAAPGEHILSCNLNRYVSWSGTSMAAPVVTGVAALMKSANPNLTSKEIENILCSTADKIPGTGKYWRCGRVNAYKAVKAAGGSPNPTPTSTPKPTVTPTPTPTPAPTSTPSPETSITFKLRFEGITEKAKDQKIKVILSKDGTTIFNQDKVNISSDKDGVYSLLIDDSKDQIKPGTYSLKVKGSSHLRKAFQNIVISTKGETIDLSNQQDYQLRSGDINDDNKITIEDVSTALSLYKDFSVPVAAGDSKMEAADVNKDGAITIQDIALIGINWSDFTVRGD